MTTTRFPHRFSLVLVLVAASAAACGSDDSDTRLSEADYKKAANAVCTAAEGQMKPIFGAIFPNLKTATEAERQKAADDLAAVIQKEIDDLAALEPPSAMSDDAAAMVEAARVGLGVVRDQGAGFWLQESDPFAGVNRRAAALGLKACAGDSSS